jgi:hypothetical protein
MITGTAAAVLALTVLIAAQTAPSATKPQLPKAEVSPAAMEVFMKALGNYGGWWKCAL